MGGQSGQLPTQVLAGQLTLTLYQPEEADCAPPSTLLLTHPALGSFLCHCF